MDVGDLSDLGEGEMRCFSEVGDHGALVCRVDGVLHAFADRCSHAAAPLSVGRLRGKTISCSLHGAGFDVRDGSHQGPPATRAIVTFAVEASDDETTVWLMPR
ncbi:MAG: 3-phenylpropionate/trans-cinnamate dioxygenase ferredoxin subunit [Candidatus Aldehydirespiratoraceae bacterium]|jgi:3-phenylpropionate/trans-cinnamate dioxygenase ferredoxin subunit